MRPASDGAARRKRSPFAGVGDGGFDKQQTTPPRGGSGLAPGFTKVTGDKGERGGMPQFEGSKKPQAEAKRDAIMRRKNKR